MCRVVVGTIRWNTQQEHENNDSGECEEIAISSSGEWGGKGNPGRAFHLSANVYVKFVIY